MTEAERHALEVHASTDPVYGSLQLNFDPQHEDDYIPVDVDEWPDVREDLRERLLPLLAEKSWWESRLAPEPGERYDILLGHIVVDEEGVLRKVVVGRLHPDHVDW